MSVKYLFPLFALCLFFSCSSSPLPPDELDEENWSSRAIALPKTDSLLSGTSYLSVYSQMYSFTAKRRFPLTGMISLRNVSEQDTIYFTRAAYFNTAGDPIRNYFDYPIVVRPLETLEIVIARDDIEGGTGSNFLFDWKIPPGCPEPLFEGVMNRIEGNQGLSFTTQAVRVR